VLAAGVVRDPASMCPYLGNPAGRATDCNSEQGIFMAGKTSQLPDAVMDRVSVPVKIVDSDTHPALHSLDELDPYMPARWRVPWHARARGSASPYWPPTDGRRFDAKLAGSVAGADPELWEQQLLGEAGVDFALLLPLILPNYLNPEQDAAMAAACNDWLADTWLSGYNWHGRYRGTVSVPITDPGAAAREIERMAGHPYVAAVQLSHAATAAYGEPQFDPIWQAAARYGLPVVMHLNSAGAPVASSYVGYPQHYMEYHGVGHPLTYAAHLVSLICRGTFDRIPDLKFIFVEGGFGWVGPVIWKLEKAVRQLRDEMSHLKRRPSEYLYENVRFTSQPSEDLGRDAAKLPDLFDLVEASRILLFSSDYPHWDFDNPSRAMPRLSRSDTKRIMYENACEIYHLPLTRESQ
jgi:uncharacterized protein